MGCCVVPQRLLEYGRQTRPILGGHRVASFGYLVAGETSPLNRIQGVITMQSSASSSLSDTKRCDVKDFSNPQKSRPYLLDYQLRSCFSRAWRSRCLFARSVEKARLIAKLLPKLEKGSSSINTDVELVLVWEYCCRERNFYCSSDFVLRHHNRVLCLRTSPPRCHRPFLRSH